jgi:hemerythrin-like domain-containing protein
MKRSPINRKKPSKRETKGLFDHIPKESKNLFAHLEKESKDEEWDRIRSELKERFAKAGIISCELQYDCCIRSYNFGHKWSFAHSLKRDQIISAKFNAELREKQIREVIYACQPCHKIIEDKGNKFNEMYDIVLETINKRKIQP